MVGGPAQPRSRAQCTQPLTMLWGARGTQAGGKGGKKGEKQAPTSMSRSQRAGLQVRRAPRRAPHAAVLLTDGTALR
jgi:hypothetical protein